MCLLELLEMNGVQWNLANSMNYMQSGMKDAGRNRVIIADMSHAKH